MNMCNATALYIRSSALFRSVLLSWYPRPYNYKVHTWNKQCQIFAIWSKFQWYPRKWLKLVGLQIKVKGTMAVQTLSILSYDRCSTEAPACNTFLTHTLVFYAPVLRLK